MRILELKKAHLPKIAVLLTGLAAAILAVTMSPQAAHATPRASNCAGCHAAAGGAVSTVSAVPDTATPVAGASYTVAITLTANPTGGNTGYGIAPIAPATGSTFGGNSGSQLAYTANMVAPAAAGTYSYTVYTNQGPTSAGLPGSKVYSITVAAESTTPPTTTPPTTTPPPTIPPPTTPPATIPPATAPAVVDGIHGKYSMTTDKCGICHRTHTARAPSLLAKVSQTTNMGSQSTLCLSCHAGGLGAKPNAGLQYGLIRPVNDPVKREYYSHDAVDATPAVVHTESKLNEFGGVINRHSECSDCHNPHQATASTVRDSVQSFDSLAQSSGWDASGRLAGVSGVSVVNSLTPGDAPAYTFLSGVDTNVIPANLVTHEYQLCFKCHSGFTKLTSNDAPLKPSQFALDKAIEFNPANPSFHPVEAAGKNTSEAMKASLAGSSPYKLWNFTVGDTVRCLNCHASSSTPNPAPTATPPVVGPEAGSALASHTSVNRGILIRNYKDRVLKSATDPYSAGDFALCYVCHAEEPFVPNGSSSTATNFSLHSKHLTLLAGKGTGSTRGTDIDTAGDGVGNAICAECHFRLHSTTNMVGDQAVDGTRLVNFAPNVQQIGTTRITWTPAGTVGSGSCTLTCHGYAHDASPYSRPTPTPTP